VHVLLAFKWTSRCHKQHKLDLNQKATQKENPVYTWIFFSIDIEDQTINDSFWKKWRFLLKMAFLTFFTFCYSLLYFVTYTRGNFYISNTDYIIAVRLKSKKGYSELDLYCVLFFVTSLYIQKIISTNNIYSLLSQVYII